MKFPVPGGIAPMLFIAMACASAGLVDGAAPFHQLASGSNAVVRESSPGEGSARVLVIRDAAEYVAIWKANIESAGAPPVDFSRQVAVLLLLGSRRTGGYGIEPSTVTATGSVITIDAPVKTPGKRAMVTDAISAPFVLLSIDRRAVTTVRWIAGEREIARSSP